MSFAYSRQASRVPCAYTPLCLHARVFMQKGAYSIPPVTSRLSIETLHSSRNTLSGYLHEPNRNNVRASFICVFWKIFIYRAVASVNPSVISQTGSLGSPHPLAGRSGAAVWCRCEQWFQEAIAQRCLELWCAIVPLTVKARRSVGSVLRVHMSLWSDGLPSKIIFPIHCFCTLYTQTHMYLTALQWAYLQETNNLINTVLNACSRDGYIRSS